ncbi:MAG: hypothetical protein HON43_04135 [Alphaproteobacteria bacterium]|nr:hypothetical protein [Alphaproteobacteria bacterium]MBT5389868.1 hypothetical protein [Alphaproteobacteria bacterium]
MDSKKHTVKDERVLPKEYLQLSQEQLTAKRLRARAMAFSEESRGGIRTMLINSPFILLSLIFFGIHWRIYRRVLGRD